MTSPKTITAPAAQSNPNAAITKPAAAEVANPFQKSIDKRTVAGVVAIESERAIAEAQGKLVLAKRFPRDQFSAFEAMRAACMRPGLAAEAIYSFPRGGSTVSGPSIRLAEELARCWGNIEYGQRELSNDTETHATEMLAFAWDLETNVLSTQQFTVRHIRDKQGGGAMLTEQRDIYEIGANMGARRMRARILAVLPADYVDAAVELCKQTNARSDGPLADRAKKLITAFAAYGVTAATLEAYLGHAIASITDPEFVELRGVYNAIKDGAKPGDYFKPPEVTAPATAPAAAPAEKPAAPASSSAPAAPAAPAGEKPKPQRRRAVIQDVDPVTGEVLPPKPAADAAPAATPAAAPAPAAQPEPAAPAAAPAAAPIESADDDIFA